MHACRKPPYSSNSNEIPNWNDVWKVTLALPPPPPPPMSNFFRVGMVGKKSGHRLAQGVLLFTAWAACPAHKFKKQFPLTISAPHFSYLATPQLWPRCHSQFSIDLYQHALLLAVALFRGGGIFVFCFVQLQLQELQIWMQSTIFVIPQ